MELRPEGIVAHVLDQKFEIRYDQCELEKGGASDRMIFCRTPDRELTIYCEQKGFLDELKRVGGYRLSTQLDAMTSEHRTHIRRHHVLILGLLAGLILLPFAAYWALRGAAAASVALLPISVDEAIGEASVGSMDLGGPVLDDPVVNEAVNDMVQRLIAVDPSEFTFNVRVVRAPTVNAFALPGGQIVIYTGLIESADSGDQVAAVVAHEIAHVTERHGLTRIANSIGIVAAVSLLLGDIGGLLGIAAELFTVATINDYGQDQESEADELGAQRLHEARVSPMALAEFFQQLLDEHGDIPDALSWIASHPQHAERIDAIRALTEKLPKTQYQSIMPNWNEVRKRALQGGGTAPVTKGGPGKVGG